MPTYRAGAVVIGSLYWDTVAERQNWRKQYFGTTQPPEALPVALPLRYGMYSRKRQCPTMVLSSDWAQKGKKGQALALPFQKEYDLPALLQAAREQSYAEGPADRRLIKGNPTDPWCLLVAWLNPHLDEHRREAFLRAWTAAYEADLSPALLARFRMESEPEGLINPQGCLQHPWPEQLRDWDLLFLTQTRPIRGNGKRNAYPDPAEIAWESAPRPSYFLCNRHYGLHTAEDQAIAEALQHYATPAELSQRAAAEGCPASVREQIPSLWS